MAIPCLTFEEFLFAVEAKYLLTLSPITTNSNNKKVTKEHVRNCLIKKHVENI